MMSVECVSCNSSCVISQTCYYQPQTPVSVSLLVCVLAWVTHTHTHLPCLAAPAGWARHPHSSPTCPWWRGGGCSGNQSSPAAENNQCQVSAHSHETQPPQTHRQLSSRGRLHKRTDRFACGWMSGEISRCSKIHCLSFTLAADNRNNVLNHINIMHTRFHLFWRC